MGAMQHFFAIHAYDEVAYTVGLADQEFCFSKVQIPVPSAFRTIG